MAYVQKGPCQPRDYKFPKKTPAGNSERRFNPAWFDEFSTWLKYSIEKDAAFCLSCYLFKPEMGEQAGGDAFTSKGFSNWKKGKEYLQGHIGGPNSSHNKAWGNYETLSRQNQAQHDCQTLLGASIDSIKFLMRQGLLFCRYDEYEGSNDQGSVVRLLRFLCDHSTDIKAAALRNSHNLKSTSCDIQKDITLVMEENKCAVYVHSFAHDLHSALIEVVKNHKEIMGLFTGVANVVSVVGTFFQCRDTLWKKHGVSILEALNSDPSNSFSAFDKLKLIQFARYYPNDFSATDYMILEDQLEEFILDMRSSIEFSTLKGISDLAEKLVVTGRDQVYPIVYLLLTLALILPVAIPRVERLFSAVNLLKNQLHNQMEDQWKRDSLIGYVEKDILDSLDNKVILQRLQHVKKFPWKLK
ncbi:hypothetical protein ACLB2K_030055 [Fragaria x ananassa]